MKKKILIITSVICLISLVVATVFFFLMKGEENSGNENSSLDAEEYDLVPIVESIEFLKLNSCDEVKKYAKENHYIRKTSDESLFAIGELYIKDFPVDLFYSLNKDNTLNRFDGNYSLKLEASTADEVSYIVSNFNTVVAMLFGVDDFTSDFYDENGMPLNDFSEEIYQKMLEGKVKLGLSVIDESNTYWRSSVKVTNKEYVNFEFFRCFDSSVYNDASPNIDLRVKEKTGE